MMSYFVFLGSMYKKVIKDFQLVESWLTVIKSDCRITKKPVSNGQNMCVIMSR